MPIKLKLHRQINEFPLAIYLDSITSPAPTPNDTYAYKIK